MDRIDEFLKSPLNKSKEDKSFSQGKEHTCPSEEIIACYLDNLLNDTEREKVEEHLTRCGDCLQQTILLHGLRKETKENGYMETPTEVIRRAKEIWISKLILATDIEKFLRSKGKNQQWFNNLNSRGYHFLPKPIVTPRLEFSRTENKVIPRGRLVFYPEEILAYLDKIIYRQDQLGLSYKQIESDPEIKLEQNKLNILVEAEIGISSRVKDTGFFDNFESAKANLAKAFKWNHKSWFRNFLDKINRDCKQHRKDYFALHKEMRERALNNNLIDDNLWLQKVLLGSSIDYCYLVMEEVIKHAGKMVKDEKISMEEWFETIRNLKR